MRCPHGTRRRPFTAWLLAAALPIALACGDRITYLSSGVATLPPSAFPAEPQSGPTEFIFLADANGTVLGRLAEGSWPSWSPDGRRVAFHRAGRVRVIGADGSGETELADGHWPTWSPDGQRIAFVALDGRLSAMNVDGYVVQTLMSPALSSVFNWGTGKPSWSPDGALIAFDQPDAYADGFPARIILMRADGDSSYAPAGGSQYETEPSWSPDGSRVVYWSTGFGLGIVDRNGGQTTQLYKDPSVAFSARPAWSPDGRTILFSRISPTASIMTIAPEGGSARVLIEQGAEAAWSPDGQRIAFVRTGLR